MQSLNVRQNQSKPSLLHFLGYLLFVSVVIVGLSGLFYYKRQSATRFAENQEYIDKYAELLKPIPPRPTPSPTAKPMPVIITKLPPKVSPSYSSPYPKPDWATPNNRPYAE